MLMVRNMGRGTVLESVSEAQLSPYLGRGPSRWSYLHRRIPGTSFRYKRRASSPTNSRSAVHRPSAKSELDSAWDSHAPSKYAPPAVLLADGEPA